VVIIIGQKKEKTGSVYYDKKDKVWKCAYYILNQETMTEGRKYESFPTEKEARDFFTSIQYQKSNHLFIKHNGIPLNLLMKDIAKKKLESNIIIESTYGRTLKTIKQIEKNPIVHKNINDITETEIQNYLNTLKNYSDSTIKKIKEQFSQAFRESVNKGYIVRNPMNNITRPKSTQKKEPMRALDIDEQQKLTNYLLNIPISNERYKVAYLIEMYLGLRIGEVLALRNSDINLHKNLIKVDKTLSKDKNNNVIIGNQTKTYAGIREIPIPSFMRNEIISQMILAENNKDNLLFVNTNGNYARPATVNDNLRALLKKLGIYGMSSHNLRHTYATRCIEAGMRAVALQRLMGHTDVSITLNTYTSIFNKFKEEELNKVNEYYINNAIIAQNQELLNENNNIIINNKTINYTEPNYQEER